MDALGTNRRVYRIHLRLENTVINKIWTRCAHFLPFFRFEWCLSVNTCSFSHWPWFAVHQTNWVRIEMCTEFGNASICRYIASISVSQGVTHVPKRRVHGQMLLFLPWKFISFQKPALASQVFDDVLCAVYSNGMLFREITQKEMRLVNRKHDCQVSKRRVLSSV